MAPVHRSPCLDCICSAIRNISSILQAGRGRGSLNAAPVGPNGEIAASLHPDPGVMVLSPLPET